MNAIPINLSELAMALEDQGGGAEHRWYLDLRTGELIMLSDFMDGDEAVEGFEDMEGQPEVFLSIEPRSSRDGFRVMEDFIETLPESEARRSLTRALRLPKPFRSFKDTLLDFETERQAWFAFSGAEERQLAIRFLEENQIEWIERKPGRD